MSECSQLAPHNQLLRVDGVRHARKEASLNPRSLAFLMKQGKVFYGIISRKKTRSGVPIVIDSDTGHFQVTPSAKLFPKVMHCIFLDLIGRTESGVCGHIDG